MKDPYLAICDTEEMYAKRLANYFYEKDDKCFRIGVFTNAEQLTAYLETGSVDVLLISQKIASEIQNDQRIKVTIILVDGYAEKQEGLNQIYKYQRADVIWKTVNKIMSDMVWTHSGKSGNKEMKLEIFYSPMKKADQTKLAYEHALQEAEKQKVLILSLSAFSGLERMSEYGFSEDLTNLICFLKEDINQFIYQISSMKQTVGRLDMLPTIGNPEDMLMIEEEKWIRFICKLKESHMYDLLVIDLGEPIKGFFNILDLADQCVQIVSNDEDSIYKINKWNELMDFTGHGLIEKKTVRVNV